MINPSSPEFLRSHRFRLSSDEKTDPVLCFIQSVEFISDPGWFKNGKLKFKFYSTPNVIRFLDGKPLLPTASLVMLHGPSDVASRDVCIRLHNLQFAAMELGHMDYTNSDVHMITVTANYSKKETIVV